MATIDYLITGGGGAGGNSPSTGGGGGGAGGFVNIQTGITVSSFSFPVVIGAGGIAPGGNGAQSSFNGSTADGGAGGSSGSGSSGGAGGSGGTGGGGGGTGAWFGGAGGTDGGSGDGGGGSSGGAGGTGQGTTTISSFSGSSVSYGGGGAGGVDGGGNFSGAPGADGGGRGAHEGQTSLPGTDGLGGGGGGGGNDTISGSNGGSGVVIVRYLTSDFGAGSSGGTKTTDGLYTIHTFTSDGTLILESPIDLTTEAVTDITQTSATGNGTVVDANGTTITERGVCWSTSPNPTTADNKSSVSGTTGSFTAPITGLFGNTTYYVRSYAISSDTLIGYGDEVTFTTLAAGTSFFSFRNKFFE